MRGTDHKIRKLKHDGHRACLFISVLAVFFSLFFSPVRALAEPDAIIYENSITTDEEEASLSMPSFVMVDDRMNEIYVVDGRSRIMIYSSDLFPLYIMNSESGIESPHGLALDTEGNLYVAQSSSNGNSRNRISVYRACLRKERDIYIDGFKGVENFLPYRLAVDRKGDIYVSSTRYAGVLVLSNRGKLIEILSPDESGRKVTITDVSLDEKGNIYLISEDEGRVYVYNRDREFVSKFGEKGGSSGKLSRPRSIAIDSLNGKIYVDDYMRHTITIYTPDGSYFHEFGGLGWGPGWFQHPNAIAIDKQGRLFVADLFNHRVQIFKTR
jgi:DNA-binding beta-propeller fold protein YncE